MTGVGPITATPNLDKALLDFQADPPTIVKDQDGQAGNQKTKYADLPQVNRKVLAKLNNLGITFICQPTMGSPSSAHPGFGLHWVLTHVPSGESREGVWPLAVDTNSQKMGSQLTYARRYILMALTGTAAEDEDDDGAGQGRTARRQNDPYAGRPTGQQTTTQRSTQARPAPAARMSDAERGKIMASFGQMGISGDPDRALRLELTSRIVKRSLGSANDMTPAERKDLIGALEAALTQDEPRAWIEAQYPALQEG